MDVSGRILAALLAILLLTVFPLQYIANNIEKSLDSHIDHYTEQLSDTIRTKGSLDVNTYESFIERLDHTGDIYDIEIEDIHPVTGEEVVVHDKDTVNLAYQQKSTNFNELQVNKNNNFSLMLNGKKTDSKNFEIISNREEIQSFATHTHTSECYAGHRHTDTCNRMPFKVQFARLKSSTADDLQIQINCAYCYNIWFYLRYTDYIYGGDSKVYLFPYHYGTYLEIPKSNTVEFNDGKAKLNAFLNNALPYLTYSENDTFYLYTGTISASAYTFDIPYTKQYDKCYKCIKVATCGLTQDETPICNQVVTSITPTNPSQTVKKGENIILTATATYLDGHTGIVNCTASGFNTNLVGTQTVTLTYSGLVGNAKTSGTRTCTMSVTVINNKTLSYIIASPATQVIKKNGSPLYSITAFYSDGSSCALSAGQCSITPIDTSTTGSKTMTISYTEGGITKSNTITVYVDDIVSISISPPELTVSKYTNAYSLPFTITATYLYSANKVITSGYSITGYNESVIGKQTLTVSYTESGKTVAASTIVNVLPLNKVCPVCGNIYDLNPDDSDPGCPVCNDTIIGISVNPEEVEVIQGGILPITVEALSRDGTRRTVTSWTSNFTPNTLGFQMVDVEYGGCKATVYVKVKEPEIICPICSTSYPVSEGRCPVCRETVISISVVPEEVTVNQYEPIELIVIAHYADGGMEEVADWSIDCTTSTPGTFTANVAYGGCTYPIKLTVLSLDRITCPICGLSYDVGENPNGCPVCSKKLIDIEAYLSSGSDMVQFGSSPSISVVLIYQDAHRELTDADYSVDGYDPTILGIQTITVLYKEFICQLEIEVVDALNTVVCPNGHVYYLNEDGSDPGCPYCVIAQSHEVVYYFDITYTYEILEILYNTGAYSFDRDNYLNISVTKKEVSLLKKLQKFSVKTVLLGRKKKYQYGGKIT